MAKNRSSSSQCGCHSGQWHAINEWIRGGWEEGEKIYCQGQSSCNIRYGAVHINRKVLCELSVSYFWLCIVQQWRCSSQGTAFWSAKVVGIVTVVTSKRRQMKMCVMLFEYLTRICLWCDVIIYDVMWCDVMLCICVQSYSFYHHTGVTGSDISHCANLSYIDTTSFQYWYTL